MKRHDVGRSEGRTRYKHFLLDAILGRVNGVLTTKACYATSPLVCVDLCAGDGVQTDEYRCSPAIMAKHVNHSFGKKNKATLTLIERNPASFELLRQNVDQSDTVKIVNGDAREYRLPKLAATQACFVHCDPNNAHQTPLTSDFVSGFSKCTMYLATLGCNAGGIKRLPLDERSKWFEYVTMLVGKLPSHHDALLFWLMNDKAQWAYMVNVPTVWRDWAIDLGVEKGSKIWEKGVGGVAWRCNKSRFKDEVHRLFLTSEELTGDQRMF
jgi:hypothetical protein